MSVEATTGYRLDPLDRAVLGPLTRRQLAVLAAGALVWLLATVAQHGVIVGAVVMVAAVAVSLPRFGGQTVVDWLPVWGGWWFRGRRSRNWLRPLHLTTAVPADASTVQPALPRWLAGLRIIPHPDGRWAALQDASAGTLTTQLQVAGRGFTTLSRAQMEFLLEGWGAVFSSIPAEDGLVRMCWSDVARPAPLIEHASWAAAQPGGGSFAGELYRSFVEDQRPMRHDLIVSVTVHAGKLRKEQQGRVSFDRLSAAVAIVVDALRDAKLDVVGPLAADEVAYLMRIGLDPTGVAPPAGRMTGSLVQRLGLIPAVTAAPMLTEAASNQVRVDRSVHRCFWVESWPEVAMGADWLEPLLSADIDHVVQRVFTLVVEPLAEGKAISELRQAAARHGGELVAAAEGRTRWDHFKARRAAAVDRRESEVASGHCAVSYAGLLTVTTSADGEAEELNRASRAMIRRFERHRVMLRPLWGRMDVGLAACLPLGLGLSREPF